MSDLSANPGKIAIEVTGSMGEWFVRVTDDNGSTARTFDRKSFALAFTEEQGTRLGADRIVVTDANEG